MEKRKKIRNFGEEKAKGDIGESLFLKAYPAFKKNTGNDVKAADFIGKYLGIKAELKTDFYNPKNTPNFFIERYSSFEDKTDGGPWQARKKGALWYVYLYKDEPNVFYWIHLSKKNLEILGSLINHRKPHPIANRGYTTLGYSIEREVVLRALDNCWVDDHSKSNYKFFSYVGSKKMWVDELMELRGQHFVEVFAGSGVLSANLARTTILNDLDPMVAKIHKNFDQQIVTNNFSVSDYLKVRSQPDWWKYAYCLQRRSFSGVFRYSKNGYNVPPKPETSPVLDGIEAEYERSKERWKKLNPTVLNGSFLDVPLDDLKDKVLILDPPYSGSKASYNSGGFDYEAYWGWVNKVKDIAEVLVVFDRMSNLKEQQIPILDDRKMRVNGSKDGDVEALAIYCDGKWLGCAE